MAGTQRTNYNRSVGTTGNRNRTTGREAEKSCRDLKKEAYEEGFQQGAIETARNMLSKNISLEIICECTNLSREFVENLLKETKQHISG